MKMYCIVAKESLDAMNGNRGKLAAQAGHAFLHAFWNAEELETNNGQEDTWDYRESGKAKKVTLVVPTVDDLKQLHAAYQGKVGTSLVKDAGLTCFKEPTITCLGIGPIPDELVGEDLRSLKVLI